MISRRVLLKQLSGLPFVGGLFGTGLIVGANPLIAHPLRRDYFKELGVRSFINAAGTYTAMTGSLMRPEVLEAIKYASNEYVNLDDIQDKAGERISSLLGCEAATVTSGAASAITLGTAGVLCGMDNDKVKQLPDLTGMKSEVIIQKKHRVTYDHAIRNTGIKLVEVESKKDIEKAINKNTAMMWFLNANNLKGQVQDEEFVAIGKKHGIPTFNDCAADVPPVENFWKYTKMGFDMVCFSGGKGIRGPQSAGLLLGKKKYIDAARLHAAPRGDTICRGMKVNKEEVLGMMVAVELYLSRDHEKDWKLWESQIMMISDAAKSVQGVETEIHVPEIANHVPSLRITWDEEKVNINPGDARKKLELGHPSIQTVGGRRYIGITTWMMDPGQERIVASRVREVLEEAAG
ncbi:aminotransferase class V-fold PLP-dependent enzyme [Bacteroidota bacterium]